MCIEAWMAKLKINIITILSIYLKHSKKKNGTLWKFSGTRYTAITWGDIIQFKKKKKRKKIPLFQTLHYIILPAQTDHLQILGQ